MFSYVDSDSRFLTLGDVAARLRASARTIRRWLELGKLPQPIRLGRTPLWK
jgi:predicted DNA-binding transcriptional regulator AlpA